MVSDRSSRGGRPCEPTFAAFGAGAGSAWCAYAGLPLREQRQLGRGVAVERGVCGLRHRDLWCDGVALPGDGLPPQVTYDDLEPYYYQAEREIGVAGSNEGNPFAAPRRQPFPMPPFALDPESQLVWNVGKQMGLHPFHVPFLRNSIP